MSHICVQCHPPGFGGKLKIKLTSGITEQATQVGRACELNVGQFGVKFERGDTQVAIAQFDADEKNRRGYECADQKFQKFELKGGVMQNAENGVVSYTLLEIDTTTRFNARETGSKGRKVPTYPLTIS
jgi:hypothetical protein